ncbi:MAG TPA: hypothetical protein VJ782_04040, partial [Aeromicrobium sp.]|nr:hypothetical protein [Aeromicrobium sp.]
MKIRSGLPRPPSDASMSRLWLRFSDVQAERDFIDGDNRAAVERARFMATLTFILSLPFGALDLFLRPGHLATLVQLRAIGLVALLVVIVTATWWTSAHRHIQLITCGAV